MKHSKKNQADLKQEVAHLRHRIAQLEAETASARQAQEILQEKLHQEQQRRQYTDQLRQACIVLHSSLNYETVLDYVLEQVQQLVEFDAGAVLLVQNGAAQVFRWSGYTRQGVKSAFFNQRHQLEDTDILVDMQHSGEPYLWSHVSDATDAPLWVQNHSLEWVQSHLCAPFRVRGQVAGFVRLDSRQPGYFNSAHAKLLTRLMYHVGLALANAEQHNRTRLEALQRVKSLKSESNFVSAILNNESALVVVLDADGQTLRINHAFQQTMGYSLKEMRQISLWDLFVPADYAADSQWVAQQVCSGSAINHTAGRWLAKSGVEKVITWSNSIINNNQGDVDYIISTGVDITGQRQLEERLLAIHHLSRELNLLRDEAEICKIAMETASFLLLLRSAGYGLLNATGHHLDYAYHPQRGASHVIPLQLAIKTEERLAALKQHQPDAPATASLDNTAAPWLSASMRVRDSIIGVMDVQGRSPGCFSAHDQQLLQTLADQTGVAIENARLYRETQRRIDELTTINVISQAISATLNPEEILTLITQHTLRLVKAAAASVALRDELTDDLWFHVVSGGASEKLKGQRLPAGQGIVGWVIQHGQSVLAPDVSQDPRFFQDFDQLTGFQTKSVICVPLISGTNIIGAIEVINKQKGQFTQADLQILTWLSTPAAIAITNARLFTAEHTARQQAERLQEVTTTLTSTLDLDQVLDSILVQLEQVIVCDNAQVLLQQNERLHLVARRGVTYNQEIDHPRQYAIDNPVYRLIRKTGEPVILNDVQTSRHLELWEKSAQIRSWMGVPLMARGQIFGCLTVDSRSPAAYSSDDAALAKAFTNQAAAAIQNARLFKQVRQGHQQLQALSRRLVQVQETERRRIARELHDEAGQALSSLNVGLRMLEKEAAQPENVIERVAALRQMTNDISENLHRLAIDLRPASLDYLGLVAALRQYIKSFSQQHNIVVEFEAGGLENLRLPSAVETNVYRIVQEALTNVSRHAQASQVDILLEQRKNKLITIVEDNGIGFNPEVAEQKERLGLLGIRERTEMFKGTLIVESTIGVGTTVVVEIPYVDKNTDR